MFNSIKNLSWMGDKSGVHLATNPSKKADPTIQGLQALIGDEPPRADGSDRFFGMENIVGVRTDPPFGNTCYCNSILQCLYYSKPFRENVVNFPVRGQPPYTPPTAVSPDEPTANGPGRPIIRVNTEPLPTTSATAQAAAKLKSPTVSPGSKEDAKKKQVAPVAIVYGATGTLGDNKGDTPEVKKKRALEVGPVLELDQGNNTAYGMQESLFTALKDLFESIMAHSSKTGIVKPNKFLEILRRENDMFNGQQHQDAHEFLNYVLNEVIENVEAHQKRMLRNGLVPNGNVPTGTSSTTSLTSASTTSTSSLGWIHELFQGQLTSETKCLTCENVSRRDENFLDLSIDLEKNSSITSCLRNFSASEMLCERNKFHCDTCGGLQEAEKRMKIKRLPKVMALHLKRFKYMEETGRFEKLHYRVVYPYHIRLFNTTDDAEDPDRLYELYAVVVHIGGGPYHGHYVAIIKTEDRGWLLFDDELVEPVDKSYVRNFFGERQGTGVASAYVLFYQETTLEAVQRETCAEMAAAAAEDLSHKPLEATQVLSPLPNGNGTGLLPTNGLAPPSGEDDMLAHAVSSPASIPLSKKERAAKKEKDKDNPGGGGGGGGGGGMSRFRNTSRSLRAPPKWLSTKTEKPPLLPPRQPPTEDALPPTTPPLPRAETDHHLHHHHAKEKKDKPGWMRIGPKPSKDTSSPLHHAAPLDPPHMEKENIHTAPPPPEVLPKKKGLHHHRPSLFGLRKKAQTGVE